MTDDTKMHGLVRAIPDHESVRASDDLQTLHTLQEAERLGLIKISLTVELTSKGRELKASTVDTTPTDP